MPATALHSDRHQLQQLAAGLAEGVMLIDDGQVIVWASPVALAMHGVSALSELGRTVDDYRQRFSLRYRDPGRPDAAGDPIERVLAGEAFRDAVVDVTPPGASAPRWVHRVRSLVLTRPTGEPDCLVLILADVTGQPEAGEGSEPFFAGDPAPAVVVRLPDGLCIRMNRGFGELSGFAREQLIGRRFAELDLFADHERPDEALRLMADGLPIPDRQGQLHGPAGARAVMVAGQPIRIDDQPCMRFTFTDLESGRLAQQASLEQSRADFEALYTETPVPLHSLDPDGRIVGVSNRWLELMQYQRHEVLDRPLTDFMTAGSAAAFRNQNWPTLLAAGAVHDLEYCFIRKSGSFADVLLSARSGFDREGAFVRTMAVLTDVTERKQSEERFAIAFNLAPVPMLLCSLTGFEIIDANQAFWSLAGPDAAYADIWPDPEQRRAFEQRLAVGTVRNLAASIRNRDGDAAECLIAAETVGLPGRRCALIVVQDVTDRRRSEAELIQAIESVMHDTSWFSQGIIEKLANLRHVPGVASTTALKELTKREQEILAQISCGRKDDAIGAALGLSRNTVRNHIAAIYAKIGVNSRSDAIVWARERGVTGQQAR